MKISESKKAQAFKVADDIGKEIDSGKQDEIIKEFSEKFKRIKMNARMRKKLAKELNIDEKKALDWKIVADVFSCIDTNTLAKEHPEQVVAIFRIVIGIVGIFAPIVLTAELLPNSLCLKIVEYSGILTPEHIVHEIASSQADEEIIDSINKRPIVVDNADIPE